MKETRTLGEAFDELRRICAEEDYIPEIPPRQERPSPGIEAIASAPLRPKMTWDSLKATTRAHRSSALLRRPPQGRRAV
jgi:hypothetical protein